MPRRRARKLTPVELLVVFAIVGILVSLLVPAMQQARRQSRAARGFATISGPSQPTEGQFNTIDPPATQTRTNRDSPPARRPGAGSVAWLAIALVIFRVINLLRRRGLTSLPRKPRHRHPPDVEE